MAKARSKAAKIKAKRGRPAKEGVMRTPSGQISRSAESRVHSGALEAALAVEAATWKRRQQNPSLTVDEARKQEHGSVIHKWLLDYQRMLKKQPDKAHPNEFTMMQHDAAVRFQQLHFDYLGVIEAKRMASSSDLNRGGGYDGRDPFAKGAAARHARIELDYKGARKAILESGPLGMMAIETVVIENRDAPELRPDLRLALNRLSTVFQWMDRAA